MSQSKSMSRKSANSKKKKFPGNVLSRFGLTSTVASVVVMQLTSCGVPISDALTRWQWPPSAHAKAPPPLQGRLAEKGTISSKFSSCPHFFAGGVAPVVPTTKLLRELCYDAFAILHSGVTRTPVFVSQRLNRQSVQQAKAIKRNDKFFADARLPRAERAELSDYKGSGFSRGHMAPAADMPNAQAMAQSFSLANMVPQNIKQNGGPWATIEKSTRDYVMRARGDVFVITGPVFDTPTQKVGNNRVSVPSHLFKLVYDAETGRSWAHWQPNTDSARVTKPISYAELVQRTGMQLIPALQSD